MDKSSIRLVLETQNPNGFWKVGMVYNNLIFLPALFKSFIFFPNPAESFQIRHTVFQSRPH